MTPIPQTTDPTRYRFPQLFSPSHTDHISNLEEALEECERREAEAKSILRGTFAYRLKCDACGDLFNSHHQGDACPGAFYKDCGGTLQFNVPPDYVPRTQLEEAQRQLANVKEQLRISDEGWEFHNRRANEMMERANGFEAMSGDLNAYVNTLKGQLEESQLAHGQAIAQRDKAQSEIAAFHAAMERERKPDWEKQHMDLADYLDELAGHLPSLTATQTVQAAACQLRYMATDFTLKANFVPAELKLEEAQRQLKKLEEQVLMLKQFIDAGNEREQMIRNEANSLRSRLTDAQNALSECDEDKDSLRTQLQNAGDKLNAFSDECNRLVDENAALHAAKAKLEEAQKQVAQLREELELARHRVVREHAKNLDELKTMPTPYDEALSSTPSPDFIHKRELWETGIPHRLLDGIQSDYFLCYTIDNQQIPIVLVYIYDLSQWTSGGGDTQKVSRWIRILRLESLTKQEPTQ